MLCALDVPLEVINWADVSRSVEPVTAGVPLPSGVVYDMAKLRITDGSGNTVPAQFRWLSKWWNEKNSGKTDNPSLKWVLCDFQADAPAKGKSDFTLRDDNTTAPSSTTLTVIEGASDITVTTGPVKFIVSKQHFNLFEAVWLDANNNDQFETGEQIIKSDSQNGGAAVSGDWAAQGCIAGTVHTTALNAPERVIIQEQGPMKVVLRIEGRHYAAANGVSKGLYGYQVFITAYAGKAYFDMQYAITNTYLEGDKPVFPGLGGLPYTAYSWPLKEYLVNLYLNLGAIQQYVLLGDVEKTGALTDSAVRLLQQKGKYGIGGDSLGVDAKGGCAISDGTLGMMVAIHDFAPRNPLGISMVKNKITLELFPDTGAGTIHWLDPYSRKNHRMRLEFVKGAITSGGLTSFWKKTDAPLRMMAPREWYQSTQAWYRGFGLPPAPQAYGWDRKTTSQWVRATKTSSSRNWFAYGDYFSNFHATGDHFNLTSAFYYWLNMGNPKDFEEAEASIFYYNDIVNVHLSANRWNDVRFWTNPFDHLADFAKVNTPEPKYSTSNITFPGFAWKRLESGVTPDDAHKCNVQELEYYLLTGDWATWDAIQDNAIAAVASIYYRSYKPVRTQPANLDSLYYMPYGTRTTARPGIVVLHGYEISGDEQYLLPLKTPAYVLRNYGRRNPLGMFTFAATATASGSYVGSAKAYWDSLHPAIPAPYSHCNADFQEAIGQEFLYGAWLALGDEEIRDALIFNGKSMEWRMGKDSTGYKGFIYSGWADYLYEGRRYPVAACDFAGSASEALGGIAFCYLASGRRDLWNVITDGWKATIYKRYYPGPNVYDPNMSGHSQTKIYSIFEAMYRHDSLDNTPPAPVTDLSVSLKDTQGVMLEWTSPGDDGNMGTAREFQIKYATAPIVDFVSRWDSVSRKGWPDFNDSLPYSEAVTIANSRNYLNKKEMVFWAASNIKNEPVPQAAGVKQSCLISGCFKDSTCYYYAMVSFDSVGNVSDISNIAQITTGHMVGIDGQGEVLRSPDVFALYPNSPNPFNPQTVIRYSLPHGNERMALRIFDLHGRSVRTLKDEHGKAGHYSLEWNGRDDDGARVASGVYFYRLKQGRQVVERKMILAQ